MLRVLFNGNPEQTFNWLISIFQGHELVLHVLYHLHSLMILDSAENSSVPAVVYEKLLLAVVGT